MLRRTLVLKAVLASSLFASLATPAVAGDLYRWRTARGGWSYVDDEKKIPESHRASAEKVASGDLADYPRYTPTDAKASASYAEGLAQRLERLRKLNAGMDPSRPCPMHDADADGDGLTVRLNERGATSIETRAYADGRTPLVVESVRMRVPDSNVTRHDVIVRRGDRIVSIHRPRAHQSRLPGALDYESDDATLR